MEKLGTVVSSLEGPSPTNIDFVAEGEGKVHKGMFVELEYSEGTIISLVTDVIKTNRYFERPDSVKEIGEDLEKHFPTADWEFLLGKARPLGVFKDGRFERTTFPPSPGTKIYKANDARLKEFLRLEDDGLMLGSMQFHDVKVAPNMSKLLQKHLAVLAMSGAGKCLKGSEKVQLADGSSIEIGKLVDGELREGAVLVDGVETKIANEDVLEVMSLSENNKVVPSKIKAFMRRKSPKNLILLKTASGKHLELTPEHPVPVIREGIEWVPAGELSAGDYSLLPRLNITGANQKIKFMSDGFSKSKLCKSIPKEIIVDESFAKLLAYLLAEGHNFEEGFSFSNDSDKIQADFANLSKSIIGEKPRKVKAGGEVRLYNTNLCTALKQIGFTSSSWTKFVPNEILKSDEKVLSAFLSAFIDCDGHINNKGIEITLASDKLIAGLENMFLRLGIVPFRSIKLIDGEEYYKLIAYGSKNASKLNKKINLLLDYKEKALQKLCNKKHNPNVEIIPNISETVSSIFVGLNMTQGMFDDKRIINYLYRRDMPSEEGLKSIINTFEKRIGDVEKRIYRVKQIFYSLPNLSEFDAKEILVSTYGEHDFKQISKDSGVSATTARRVFRGITRPKNSSFKLAQNCLKLMNKSDIGIGCINEMDFQIIAKKLLNFCNELNVPSGALCMQSGLNKNALYAWSCGLRNPEYSNLYSVAKGLFKESLKIELQIPKVKKKINLLCSLIDSNIFFDKITAVEKVKSKEKYVYDLSVDNHSFTANNLIVHNSYGVSVLIEELLLRKKEQGQIALVVLDTHGEYTCFGEPVTDKKYVDFSSKTRIVDASKMKIAASKINSGFMGMILPNLSGAQRRDLSQIVSKLSKEMKSGVGPFDLNTVKSEIMQSNLNEKSASMLLGILAELEELNLFTKIDDPSIQDLVEPGKMVVIDFSNVISQKKKQILTAYLANKLFTARRLKKVPPFALFVEEAHNYIPEKTGKENAMAKGILRTIAREGRKFGAALVIISQRPKYLDTTTLANCNTHLILRITNPYDLDHIKASSEGLDSSSISILPSLRVGEGMLIGEAVSAPTLVRIRERKSQPSKHESTLEESAKKYSSSSEQKEEEADAFL